MDRQDLIPCRVRQIVLTSDPLWGAMIPGASQTWFYHTDFDCFSDPILAAFRVPKSIQNPWQFASERRQILAWVFRPLCTAFLDRKWYQNHSKCRPGRILKTAVSCGIYCKNQGLGPSHGMKNLFRKSCGNILHFWWFLGAVWHLFGHPHTLQHVLNIVSNN